MNHVPWFMPGVAMSIVLGLVLSGPLARTLRARRVLCIALVVSAGAIVAATLTPLERAAAGETAGTGVCDFSRIRLASLAELRRVNDVSLNILLFVPLGASIGLLPRSRVKLGLVITALALPFGIEITQLLVRSLDRACESADVIDNLTGLTLGLAAGLLVGAVIGQLLAITRGRPDPTVASRRPPA